MNYFRVALALIAICGSAGIVLAHQSSVPLTFWADNFKPADARCQIVVGSGAARCGQQAWDIRRRCLLAQLDGQICDEDADDDAIEALRIAVFQGDIDPVCREADLPTLLFSDPQDVQFDVITFCREFESALVSAVFNPFFAAAEPTAMPEADKQCIRSFAAVTTKAFNFALRSRKSTLDRIANRRRSARVKNRDVARSDTKVQAAQQVLLQSLTIHCDPSRFEQLYNFAPAAMIELVSRRSDCFADQTYPVRAYDCPAPVCGNGMRETNEGCDDGNLVGDDGCSPTCRRGS